jgi:hypothetical protein
MPTEKHRRHAGSLERVMSRRRISLNEYGGAALKLFIKYDLFDRFAHRSRVPDERLVPGTKSSITTWWWPLGA